MILDSELSFALDKIDFSADLVDLSTKIIPAEKHSIICLFSFLATKNSIASNNLVFNLYKHINTPEGRLYLSHQLYKKALHAQFYQNLLNTYIPNPTERAEAFSAVENLPSIKKKTDFCLKWMNSIHNLNKIENTEDRRNFLMNMICFSTCIEGVFSSVVFAYINFIKSKGLLEELTLRANQVFKDESINMAFTVNIIETIKEEDPNVFNEQMKEMIIQMLEDAIDCEITFTEDFLSNGLAGLSLTDMRQYLEFIADQYLESLHIPARYNTKNPFEKRVCTYQAEICD